MTNKDILEEAKEWYKKNGNLIGWGTGPIISKLISEVKRLRSIRKTELDRAVELKNENESLTKELAEWMKLASASDAKNLRLTNDLADVKKEVERLRSEREAEWHVDNSKHMEGAFFKSAKTIESLTKELEAVKKERDMWKETAEGHALEIENQEESIAFNDSKISQLERELREDNALLDEYSKVIKADGEKIKTLEAENAELKFANQSFVDEAMKGWEPTTQEQQVKINQLRIENAKLREKVEEWKQTASNYRIRLSNHLRKEPKT